MAWLMVAVLFVWGGIGYMKSSWTSQEFTGAVRSTIHMNPLMGDAEMGQRLGAAATKLGVKLDPGNVHVERGGLTVMSAGGIESVKVRYSVPVKVLVFSWSREVRATVRG